MATNKERDSVIEKLENLADTDFADHSYIERIANFVLEDRLEDRRQFAERVLAAGPEDWVRGSPDNPMGDDPVAYGFNKANEQWRAAIASQLSGGEPLPTYTQMDVRVNSTIGWFIEDNLVKQTMSLAPRTVRIVGRLSGSEENNQHE